MIVKFFRHGQGGSKGVISYLLGKNGNREHAKVLQGDVALTELLIDSSTFKNKYKSGVLSFEELARVPSKKKNDDEDEWDDFYLNNKDTRIISEQEKKEIMQRFEDVIFAGLESDQFNILWIEHSDKGGRLELNFVIPRLELRSGKAFNPYYHAIDEARVNAFKSIVNYDFKLTDPDAPNKKRFIVPHADNAPRASEKDKDLGKVKYDEVLKNISEQMQSLLDDSRLKTRKDTMRYLKKMTVFGELLKVKREGKNTVSVRHPLCQKNHRLKGEIYQENFKYEQSNVNTFNPFKSQGKTQKEKDQEVYEESAYWRYHHDKQVLDELIEMREVYIKERYQAKIPEPVEFKKIEVVKEVQVEERKKVNRPRFGR